MVPATLPVLIGESDIVDDPEAVNRLLVHCTGTPRIGCS